MKILLKFKERERENVYAVTRTILDPFRNKKKKKIQICRWIAGPTVYQAIMEILSSYVPIEILELILKKSSFNGIVLSIS